MKFQNAFMVALGVATLSLVPAAQINSSFDYLAIFCWFAGIFQIGYGLWTKEEEAKQ